MSFGLMQPLNRSEQRFTSEQREVFASRTPHEATIPFGDIRALNRVPGLFDRLCSATTTLDQIIEMVPPGFVAEHAAFFGALINESFAQGQTEAILAA